MHNLIASGHLYGCHSDSGLHRTLAVNLVEREERAKDRDAVHNASSGSCSFCSLLFCNFEVCQRHIFDNNIIAALYCFLTSALLYLL